MEYENLTNEPIYCSVLDIDLDPISPRCSDLNSKEKYGGHGYTETEALEYTAQQRENNIPCTYCINFPQPAVKYCLLCKASLCVLHKHMHSKSKEHVLTTPMRLQSGKCTNHKELLKSHSSKDDAYLCVPHCQGGNHNGHNNELLNEACQKKKRDLQDIKDKLISKQKEVEERAKHLQKKTVAVEERGAEMSERVRAWFRNLRAQLDNLEQRVLSDIYLQQENVSRPLSLLIKQLDLKNDELSKSIKQIEKLCNLSNPFPASALEKFDYWETKDGHDMVYDLKYFDEGLISVTLQRYLEKIIARAKWEQGATDILLDVNTAADNVYLSGDKKTISWSKINQRRQKNPKRFKAHQVLSIGSFSSGRHYWEVETSESGKWMIGMCYPSIDRKGDQSYIGYNNKSWGLGMLDKYRIVHDHQEKDILNFPPCNRIGIYLDYNAGQLSFYELCDPIRHLHTFTATFTEPLHAIFWVWYGWVRIRS